MVRRSGVLRSNDGREWRVTDTRKGKGDRILHELAADRPVSCRWITEEELDRHPELVRTLSVQPPRGAGRIRLLEIAGVDLQPCGGTHVRSTGEVGSLVVTRVENKGRHNKRVHVAFA